MAPPRPVPALARAQTDPIVITLTDSRHRRSPQFHNPAWRYAPVVHFVRHPLAAIGSLARKCGRKPEHADVDADEPMTEEQWTNLSWAFVAENFPALPGAERPLARALHYWRVWNLAAEELAAWRVRVEDYSRVALLEHLGLGGDAVRLAKAKAIDAIPGRCKGFKPPSTPTTWAALRAEDARLAAKVREQAARYGYDPDDALGGCEAPPPAEAPRQLSGAEPATTPVARRRR